jgi:hypothetical protein
VRNGVFSALFNVMRRPLTMLPQVINSMVETRISLGRLQKFFLAEEIDGDLVQRLEFSKNKPAIEIKGSHSFLLLSFNRK